MTEKLKELQKNAHAAGAAFDEVCKVNFPDGRWGYYRAMEGVNLGKGITKEMHTASDKYNKALMALHKERKS